MWVTAGRFITGQDLSPYGGGRDEAVWDMGVREYDLRTGHVIYTWDALNPGGSPHVALSESEEPPPQEPGSGWDPYHLNSLQVLPDGELLISMRNTWSVYLIDPRTGTRLWTLGGKRSSFGLGPGARFAWQHDARLITAGADQGLGATPELTLYNDNCCLGGQLGATLGPSEGMVLRLDTLARTASLVAAYRHTPALHTPFLGSMELDPGGNALVGWGSSLSEYSSTGRELLYAVWPGKDESYRVLGTRTWIGTPYYPPSGAARTTGGHATVYASWNGATQVAGWQVLAGPSAGDLKPVAVQPRTGFETAIRLRRAYRSYRVRALDAADRPLRASKVFSG
jgi:hypothetical protein